MNKREQERKAKNERRRALDAAGLCDHRRTAAGNGRQIRRKDARRRPRISDGGPRHRRTPMRGNDAVSGRRHAAGETHRLERYADRRAESHAATRRIGLRRSETPSDGIDKERYEHTIYLLLGDLHGHRPSDQGSQVF